MKLTRHDSVVDYGTTDHTADSYVLMVGIGFPMIILVIMIIMGLNAWKTTCSSGTGTIHLVFFENKSAKMFSFKNIIYLHRTL